MYLDLVHWSPIFSDEQTEGKEGGAVADWEDKQYRNNRASSAAWSWMFFMDVGCIPI